MFNLIERFMDKLTIEQTNNFALKNGINLNPEELEFVFHFTRKNWQQIISNPRILNLKKYQHIFSDENFIKIEKLFNEYSLKYSGYL